MFGTVQTHQGYNTEQIADSVWKDIKKQNKSTHETIFNETVMACIEVDGDLNLIVDKFFPDADNRWEIYEQLEAIRDGKISDISKQYPNSIAYIFNYSDDCGEFGSMMEHSNIFSKLPHERTSHH